MWLKSRGIEPTSPEGFTLAQIGPAGTMDARVLQDSGSMASAFGHRIQDFYSKTLSRLVR